MRTLLLVLFLVVCPTVIAQAPVSTKPDVVIRDMAIEASSAQLFVPQGWEIVHQVNGNLNGDKLADTAVAVGLTEDNKEMLDNSASNCESPPYIVVVLFGKQGGGYTRAGVNGKLFPQSCEHAIPTLAIKNAVLIVNHNWRDGWAMDTTYRFRYDAQLKKMVLIGFDSEHYSRSNIYEGNKLSENYLTGVRVLYAKSHKQKSSVYSEVKREQIQAVKVAFERTGMNETDSDGLRPFLAEDATASAVMASVTPAVSVGGSKTISGTWQWTSSPNKNKEQVYFSVDIKQTGNKVSGRYWFNQITDGEGDDASWVPFVGTVVGDTISIEFDPDDIHGITEENVRYRRPTSPSMATLVAKNGKLEWTVTKGSVNAGDLIVPRQVTLTREH